jgi:hypothetical protein
MSSYPYLNGKTWTEYIWTETINNIYVITVVCTKRMLIIYLAAFFFSFLSLHVFSFFPSLHLMFIVYILRKHCFHLSFLLEVISFFSFSSVFLIITYTYTKIIYNSPLQTTFDRMDMWTTKTFVHHHHYSKEKNGYFSPLLMMVTLITRTLWKNYIN